MKMLYGHGAAGVRLADNYHREAPWPHVGLTAAEMERVAQRDLGCSRRSTYRDLGRGPKGGLGFVPFDEQ